MNLKNFRDGLAILAEHFKDPDGYHLGAEHDQFHIYATDVPLPPLLIAKLKELGWFQEGVESDDYDPEEGWSCFV